MPTSVSVLVPVFQWDVRSLAQELTAQHLPKGTKIEILFYDDASSPAFRQINSSALQNLPAVRYKQLHTNLGRARIRNLMAREAQNEYLLFLDCDATIPSPLFIQNYLDKAQKNTILNGGAAYHNTPPPLPQQRLRWLYGRQREQKSASIRNQNPHRLFHTFNFFIPRSVMLRLPFNENLRQYGYEDVLFAHELKRQNYLVKHIDNPAIHLDIDTAEAFLKKTRQSLENLLYIKNTYPHFSTPLLKAAAKYRHLPLPKTMLPLLEKHLLHSQHPSLKLFDLYKLILIKELLNNA